RDFQPGFETSKDNKQIEEYNKKIMHETLRVSLCDRLEQYLGWKTNDIKVDSTTSITRHFCTCREKSPFEDLAKRLFLLYYDIYMDVVNTESAKVKEKQAFQRMPFEGGTNSMEGIFEYSSLKERLQKIYSALVEESDQWCRDSAESVKEDTTTASNLRSQFEQIQESKDFENDMMVDLEENNPFIWNVSIIGLPATQYDGGMFRARMVFHKSFPEVWPRVRFSTEVFHPNITRDGVPYYRVKRVEDVRQHLEALRRLFTEDPDSSPATHVGVKAASLYFGSKEQRRDFNRNARRCAQRSMD
ncbi:hypothetical protein HK102_001942, partial [Quaeritorhiza haematococci]